jgi:quinol monooxygenase YgiN
MHTRLFYATIQPGRVDDALVVIGDLSEKVRKLPGCLGIQVLQGGDDVVGITTWATEEDLGAYAEGDVAREMFARLTPLLMGAPVIKSYEVRVNLWEPPATWPA